MNLLPNGSAGAPGLRLPGANAASVDVHEVRPGVVAHAAASQPPCTVPDASQLHAGQPDVDGLAFHVEAVLGDPVLCARNVWFVRGER